MLLRRRFPCRNAGWLLKPREILGERLHLRVVEPRGDLAHHATRVVLARAGLEVGELLHDVRRILSGKPWIAMAAGAALAMATPARRYAGGPIAVVEESPAGRRKRGVAGPARRLRPYATRPGKTSRGTGASAAVIASFVRRPFAKSASCFCRYSVCWPARFGYTGTALLPLSPWHGAHTVAAAGGSGLTAADAATSDANAASAASAVGIRIGRARSTHCAALRTHSERKHRRCSHGRTGDHSRDRPQARTVRGSA